MLTVNLDHGKAVFPVVGSAFGHGQQDSRNRGNRPRRHVDVDYGQLALST